MCLRMSTRPVISRLRNVEAYQHPEQGDDCFLGRVFLQTWFNILTF